MTPQILLAILLHAVVLAIFIWDGYCLAHNWNDRTVSVIVRAWSKENPILPLVVGILIGHIFW